MYSCLVSILQLVITLRHSETRSVKIYNSLLAMISFLSRDYIMINTKKKFYEISYIRYKYKIANFRS